MRFAYIILFVLQTYVACSQTLGGEVVYQFLKLPTSPMLSATGGVNVSFGSNDIGLALNNPALLNEGLHSQVGLSFNSFFAGSRAYHLSGSYHSTGWQTTFGGSVFFVDYGSIVQTDANGNAEGVFHPKDYVLQLSGAKAYLQKWQYGFNVKLIRSEYGQYRSSGIAFDVGVLYKDSASRFSASILARNMGAQLSTYHNNKEDLPFDMQIGVTKRLSKAPFGFSVTVQQLHRFNLTYSDTAFNDESGFTSRNTFLDKLFDHFVVASHVYIGNNLELAIGYNRLRRSELNLGSAGNGLNGFSGGFAARFRKFQLQYSRAYFQRSSAYNHLGVTIVFKELNGLVN